MGNFKNENNYTKSVPVALVYDSTLSDRARFVYVFMTCKPEDWSFFLEPMAKEIGYSVDTLRKYINELIASGWLIKGEQQNENGKFGAVEYTLKATKISDTENFRHGKNPAQHKYSLPNTMLTYMIDNNKEEDTNVSPKKGALDYRAVIDCWNDNNSKRCGRVTKLTERRKKAIKRIIDEHDITQDELMRLFQTLPYADSWLYNPNGSHKNWKPDFDWWMANTNGWFTKALEGKVHLQNTAAFNDIMKNGKDCVYTPVCEASLMYNEQQKCYMYIGYWDGRHIPDGYDDDNRPDGASVTLNNGRGILIWDKEAKQWKNR